jgi:hypothetical protein
LRNALWAEAASVLRLDGLLLGLGQVAEALFMAVPYLALACRSGTHAVG